MAEEEQADLEPESAGTEQITEVPKGRRSLSKIKRELTEDELKSPAVQKLLIDELERLERNNGELTDYRDRFYSTDKKLCVLEEKLKKSLSSEIISSACFVIGAAALGYAPALWNNQPAGWISVVFGGGLITAGIWAKAVIK
jgi:hypothetical protein